MVIFRSNFSLFLSFNTQLTHLNASNLLNFNPSNRFLPIASQSWCSGVSKMATYIYIYISCRFICSKIAGLPHYEDTWVMNVYYLSAHTSFNGQPYFRQSPLYKSM